MRVNLAENTPSEFFGNPQNPRTKEFLEQVIVRDFAKKSRQFAELPGFSVFGGADFAFFCGEGNVFRGRGIVCRVRSVMICRCILRRAPAMAKTGS